MTAARPAPSTAFRALSVGALIAWTVLAWPGLTGDRLAPLSLGVLAAVTVVGLRFPSFPDRAVAALQRPTTRTFVAVCAAVAALISYLLVIGPLRDRPSSIDAHVYLFQARALSHGHFGMPLPEPQQVFGARFLFAGDDGRLYGVFPPGFPLFLVPFVWAGAPMLAGPVLAALLVVSQSLLGHALEGGRDGVATRLAIVLSLPSLARAVETADLLSHAFVAVLGTAALALSVQERVTSSRRRLLAIGALLGWALIARLLDGVVLTALVAALLVGRVPLRRALLPLLAALPFLMVLALGQRAATGSWWMPTQSLYFARSDWPPTCHRLGLGVDVGCAVEHGDERASFGADGYTLGDALRVVRERAGALGADLLGFAPAALLGFAAIRKRRDAFLAGAVLTFTLAYGLFYYGNAPVFGARHLFPIAPLLWLLVARAVVEPLHPRLGRSLAPALVAVACVAAAPRFLVAAQRLRADAGKRVDVRGMIERAEVPRGLVVTGDQFSFISSFDPYRDGGDRLVALFDGSGLQDLRRTYPELPMHSLLAGDTRTTQQLAPPPPGLLFELERGWPSFVRPNGVASRTLHTKSCCGVEASGDRALFLFVAEKGGSLSIPFTVARGGRYALRVDGLVSPDYGTWSVRVDEHPLPEWDGYADTLAHRRGAATEPIDVAAGRHVITFTCTGKRPESRGMLAAFDALVGNPSR